MDIAQRWNQSGLGQIAVVVSLGTEHGRVCGRVANADCVRTRTSCGHGCGLDKATASWPAFAGLVSATSETLRWKLRGRFIGGWADAARTLRGHGLAADWSWTGCGGGHRAGHSPALARTLSVHCPDAGRIISGYCPDTSPEDTRIIRRTLRRTSCRMMRGHCAVCGLTFM